jgi:hypothetical protein
MRSAFSLFSMTAVLCGIGVAQAADPSVPAWHHTTVSRLDQSHPGPAAAAEAGPQKYLHIGMQINDPSVVANRDKFRIVDASGAEVAGSEVWGYNDAQKLLIVEGHWGSLAGLYLDGFGHREPLFEQVAVAPAPRQVVATPVQPVADWTVVAPRTDYVAPRTDYVAPRTGYVHDDYVVAPRTVYDHDTVVVGDRTDYVGDHHTVVVDDRDYGHDTVVVEHRGHGSSYGSGGGGYGSGSGDSGSGGGGSGYAKAKGKKKGMGKGKSDDSADANSDDVTISDPGDAGNAIAQATGINPDKANSEKANPEKGSEYGKGSGSGKDGSGGKDGSDGSGSGKDGYASKDSGKGDGQGQGQGDGQGSGEGQGQGSGDGQGQGQGSGDGQGQGQGDGQGQGTGDGQGQGSGDGSGKDAQSPASADGSGSGEGSGPGDGSGPGEGSGPGSGPGCGCGPSPYGPGTYGPSPYGPGTYGPGPYGRAPYGPYYPYGNYSPYYQAPQQPATADAPMYGGKLPLEKPKLDKVPELVLYVSTGDLAGPGKVYQVKGTDGQVMGKANLDKTATGISMYRDKGVVVAIPRDGGKIVEIDDTGKQSTILEKDPSLLHPVKISMPGNSDTMVVADDTSNQLVMSTIAGTKTRVYQKLPSSYSSQPMSVAVANDKGVVFSSEAQPGVHKYMGDQSAGDKPVLPMSGGVAADHSSLRWAAAQAPNVIKVYEGQQFLKNLRLPPEDRFYKGGLMSFAPDGSLCVAVQNDKDEVWILSFHVDKNQVTNSFKWTHEEMQDFAVGTRMPWDRHSPSGYKSTF